MTATTRKGNQDKGRPLLASSCHLTPVIPTPLSSHPAPTAQAFLFQENVKSSISLGLCVRCSPSRRPSFPPESPLDWFNPSMAVMKFLTKAILECSDPERNRYKERSHWGEKVYAGSQSPGTIPDSR